MLDIWQKPLHFLFLAMIIGKKGKYSVLFPIAICMPLFYLLWAKVILYTCSLKNMELIRLEFSSVNISTIMVNCCFLTVFHTVFRITKKRKKFISISNMTLTAQTVLHDRCWYLVFILLVII